MSDAGDAHDIGSLGEEAAKLLGALSGWAREHAVETGDALSGMAGHAAASAHDLNEHLATGSAECTVCPICRSVHAVRQLSPEVKAQLATAMTSLAQAAAAILAPPDVRAEGSGDVEHIDLDDEWPGDE